MSQTPTMPEEAELEFDPQLIDCFLKRPGGPLPSDLAIRISASPALLAQHEELRGAFNALDSLTDISAPAGLAQRICAKVRSTKPALRWHAAGGSDDGERVIRLTNFRDITAVAATIVLAIGLGVPSLLQMRERNERMLCSANLAEIGRGLQAYAAAYGDSLPFAGWQRGDTWASSHSGGATVPNRRHLYPLLASHNVSAPQLFICPSSEDVPMSASQIALHNDFIEDRNISYANQNMAGVRPSLKDNPSLPILGDDNPFFSSGVPILDLAARGLRLNDARQNSRAHGGAGQNILALDGAVKWTTTPDCGIDGDNIWTLKQVANYTGREGPAASTDSHLIK